ncbi:C6 zinc finger domain protein [Xylariales sp. AK1849]|nr:C6 zinc finger domain protein [Xylariales sp. AK1849]
MVGVPRSKGCQTCIQRRTKCDEARPACGNCLRYGAVCPGYYRGLKFVAGKHTVRSRGRRQTRGGGGASAVQGRVLTTYEMIQSAVGQARMLSFAPRHNSTQFIGTLLDTVRDSQPKTEYIAFGGWFDAVTSRLGNKATLDISICSFALHLLGKQNKDEQLIAQSRTLYGHALGVLHKTLNHPTDWKTPETLWSATILCLFELFAGTSTPESWMRHASGITRLMQLRGPQAYEANWEKSILLSFRPIIIMNCLFAGQDCFLAEAPWQSVIQHDGAPSSTIAGTVYQDSLTHVDRYFQLLAKLPSILRHAYALREANKSGDPVDVAKVLLLMQATEKVHSAFAEFYPAMLPANPTPKEVPTKDPQSMFPTVLEFKNPWAGAIHMGYWASMLILQESLNQCYYPIDYTESNRMFMLNILRSVETVSEGIMGPYRCGYGIRIAYEFADEEQKAWIRLCLDRFEKTYAATSSKSYPG